MFSKKYFQTQKKLKYKLKKKVQKWSSSSFLKLVFMVYSPVFYLLLPSLLLQDGRSPPGGPSASFGEEKESVDGWG